MDDRFKSEIDAYKENKTNNDLVLNRTFDILRRTNDSMNELTFEEWCQFMSYKFCSVLEKFPQVWGLDSMEE